VYFLDPDGAHPPELPPWPNAVDDLSTKPWPQRSGHSGRGWSDERWEYYRRFYRSKVEKVDALIAQLLDELNCTGYAPTTWTFFTADHGDMAGEHGLPFKGPFMYDGVTRVPLVVMPPRRRLLGARNMDPAGARGFAPRTFPGLVSHVDLAPTMLELAGLPADPALPGRSLLPVLEGRSQEGDEAVFAEWHQMGKMVTPVRMIRTGQWKYNWYLHNGEELYDLASDPHELTNLAGRADLAQTKADLKARLLANIEKTKDPFFSHQPTDREGRPRRDYPE
jgi:choline-sulfatase